MDFNKLKEMGTKALSGSGSSNTNTTTTEGQNTQATGAANTAGNKDYGDKGISSPSQPNSHFVDFTLRQASQADMRASSPDRKRNHANAQLQLSTSSSRRPARTSETTTRRSPMDSAVPTRRPLGALYPHFLTYSPLPYPTLPYPASDSLICTAISSTAAAALPTHADMVEFAEARSTPSIPTRGSLAERGTRESRMAGWDWSFEIGAGNYLPFAC